ncbi:hypothetical protein F4779DRAFT_616482 [Xylariaceae sp. FL0662B]|nr:hypothetical protein F4779DRAFT_616482 [Xylariaceae sp. FL0662B]
MANDHLPASLGFLTDAAHLLATSAPETSAYLMAQRNSLMFNNDILQSDVQRQHVCGSCGHIMIAGQGEKLNIETNKAFRKKSRSNIQKPQSAVAAAASSSISTCRKRFTCGMCGRYTDIVVPPPAPISRHRQKQLARLSGAATKHLPANMPSNMTATAAKSSATATATANASSKKRAKSRKQGLQALLQQSQSSSSKPQTGLGLSLSDFMMK